MENKREMDLKEKILEKIDSQFVIDMLSEFGSDYKRRSSDIRFLPVCHGGDNYTLVFYENAMIFNCLTCCGYMDIFELVKHVKGCSFSEALHWLANRLGISDNRRHEFRPRENEDLKRVRELLDGLTSGTSPVCLPELDGGLLPYFDAETFYQGWIDEGISIETMQRFGIRWHEYRKWIIIPCRDIDGRLVGVRRRALVASDGCKYMPLQLAGYDYCFSVGMFLYGAYENQDIIRRLNRCIIFEGEKSVMKAVTMYGEYPCVATCGSHVSAYQMGILRSMNVKEVILAYDFDDTGREKEKFDGIKSRLEQNGFSCEYLYNGYTEYLDPHESPIDKGQGVFETLMKARNTCASQ